MTPSAGAVPGSLSPISADPGPARLGVRGDLPSTGAPDRVTKRQLYAHHGVEHYWLVDPIARTLEALALQGGIWVDAGAFDETTTARIPPFQAIEIPVGRLFLPRGAGDEPDE